MDKVKRLLSLGLVFVMVITMFSACGKKDDNQEDSTKKTTKNYNQMTTEAPTEKGEIILDKKEVSIPVEGAAVTIVAEVTQKGVEAKDLVWSSKNSTIVTVEGGVVTPHKVGTTTIVAATKDESIFAECTVTITEKIKAESVKLDKTSVSLFKYGSTASVDATMEPANTDSVVVWTSSDPEVAQVYEGVIIAGNVGNAVITATTSSGKTAECTVEVKDDKQLITNDMFYRDTEGNTLYSQGGGIFKFGDTYYWYGVRYKESKLYVKDPLRKTNVEHPVFEAFTCYTSTDLVNWKYEGDVATLKTLGEPRNMWAGRMGVVYHKETDKYILVSQFDGTIIAKADSPLGPFSKVKKYSWGALPVIANKETGDQTMFQDDDGKAYMICSSAKGRAHLYIVPMREEDFCDFDFGNIKEINCSTKKYYDEDGTIKTKDKGGIEGNCMFKYKGMYYFTGSDLYGWHGSRAYVFQSEDIMGDYKVRADYDIKQIDETTNYPYIMKNAQDSYAHNSQTGFYYTLKGSKQDTVIYCGDRWSSFCSNGLGFNQWVPLSFEGENNTAVFNDMSQWRLNAETGEWSIAEGNNYISNAYFDADRVDRNQLVGWESSDNKNGESTGNVKDKRYSGKYSARHSGGTAYKAETKQLLTDLPDGVYTLRASVKSSGGQNECVVYAKAGDKEYSANINYEMKEWTDIVVKDVVVKDGKCEVGFRSDANAGNYVRVDDMYFTKNMCE